MRHYESTIVLDPVLQDDGYNKQMDRIKKFIEERGGNILLDDRWGLRTLAYKIKKQNQGYYGILEWESPGELIGELDHMLRLDEHILRHLILYLDPKVLEIREELKLRRASRIQGDDKVERSIPDNNKEEHHEEDVIEPQPAETQSQSEEAVVDDADEEEEVEQESTEDSGEEVEQEDTEDSGEEVAQENTEDSGEEVEQESTEDSEEAIEQDEEGREE